MNLDFTLTDHDGNAVTADELAGSKTILFFYPKAMTPGCTTEACDFRDSYDDFREAGYQLVGVSPDPPAENARFREKEGLEFHLLSDQDHSLAESLGAWGTKKLYGREVEGLIRSTFVFDESGVMTDEFRNVRARGHVEFLRRELLST